MLPPPGPIDTSRDGPRRCYCLLAICPFVYSYIVYTSGVWTLAMLERFVRSKLAVFFFILSQVYVLEYLEMGGGVRV